MNEENRTSTQTNDFISNNKTKLSISAISIPQVLTSEINPKLIEIESDDRESEKKSGASGLMLSEAESDLEEMVEEMQVFVSDEGHVERLELLHDGKNKSTIADGSIDKSDSGEELGSRHS